jgi:hypothetical protein
VGVIGAGGRRRGAADGTSGGRGKAVGQAEGQAALFPDDPDAV